MFIGIKTKANINAFNSIANELRSLFVGDKKVGKGFLIEKSTLCGMASYVKGKKEHYYTNNQTRPIEYAIKCLIFFGHIKSINKDFYIIVKKPPMYKSKIKIESDDEIKQESTETTTNEVVSTVTPRTGQLPNNGLRSFWRVNGREFN